MSDPRLDRPPGLAARAAVHAARALLPLGPPPPAGELRSILVVRTDDRVGNALLTLPLVRALQRALPQARVDLLLASRRAAVADGLEGISLVRFEKTDAFRHPLRFARLLWRLRSRYDAVIDAAHWHAFSLTSALLSRWAARRLVVGVARGPAIYSATVALPQPGALEVEAKVELVRGLGLEPPAVAPPLETALGRSAPKVAPGRYVAMNPGARKEDHRWSPAGFAALARALHARRGLRTLVLHGPGEEPVARAVVEAAGEAALLAPPTDLEELAALLRGAALVVTNDTGPMHLAVACGAPVLAIFLEEEGLRWGHPGPRFAAVVPARGDALAAAERLLDSAVSAAEPPRTLQGVP